jgi:hypothetical protein
MSKTAVKFENSLGVHDFTFTLLKNIETKIKAIGEYETKRLDGELTKWVCKFIDSEITNSVRNTKAEKPLTESQASEINKSAVAVQALKQTFNLSDSEVSMIESQVKFLFDNGIIKVPVVSKAITKIKALYNKI